MCVMPPRREASCLSLPSYPMVCGRVKSLGETVEETHAGGGCPAPVMDEGGGRPDRRPLRAENVAPAARITARAEDGAIPPRPLRNDNPATVERWRRAFPVACARCDRAVQIRRGAEPFRRGPYKGRFLCLDCFVLHQDENPGPTSTPEQRLRLREEADKIRLERGDRGELLYQDAEVTAWLTPRGHIWLDLKRTPFAGPEEFDAFRYRAMMRAFKAAGEKLPKSGFDLDPWGAETLAPLPSPANGPRTSSASGATAR